MIHINSLVFVYYVKIVIHMWNGFIVGMILILILSIHLIVSVHWWDRSAFSNNADNQSDDWFEFMKKSHFCTATQWGTPYREIPSSWGDPVTWTGCLG